MHVWFWWRNLRKGDHLEDRDVNERITKWIFKKADGGMKTVINLWIP